ncbi:glycerol-3-phosphate dehydrogenase SDP6, mitochondrial-like isoform X2 [Silene latifolia]|uniref:glycerol-3-phosphate dehydrogenase SDP6, mitochondrial-like isoform X2 n=1 Tax=Silene latifolia TaxID=37657 RepID=UPI003D783A97
MASAALRLRRIGIASAAVATAASLSLTYSVSSNERPAELGSIQTRIADPNAIVPPRKAHTSSLISSTKDNPLDLLIVGGGATGCGVALDAVTRGLRVGLVEREDFSSGTSSRSTKLVHGGVRYLEKAVFNVDYGQLKLVFHALKERKQVIDNAPHLCHSLPCMTPCFEWFEVVYYWAGLKLYDLVAGPRLLHLSRYYSAQESIELFPTLSRTGQEKSLKGTVVYHDGQMNDSRLNVGLACTAALAGASVLNYAEVVSLLKDENGRIIGARIHDNLSEPHEDEIQFILEAISDYLNVKVRRTDVLSAWSGIRPLAMDPRAKNTESISRDHVVCEDFPGLVTITGGKWTTYRSMAEDAVDVAIKSGALSPANKCMTDNLILSGGYGWHPAYFTIIAQQYVRMKKTYGGEVVPGIMDTSVAKHLSQAYGTLCERVASIAQNEGLGKRLAHGYPFLEAEVAYCARYEYCECATDFIARRCRLAFLDTDAAGRALPRVINILAAEHNWDKSRKDDEVKKAKEFLNTFKSSKNAQFHDGKHK